MLHCFSHLKLEDLGLFCVCLWKVWSLQNADVHESTVAREVDVVDWARGFIHDFHGGRLVKGSMPPTISFRNLVWIPLDPGMYKINFDVVIDRLVGFRTVIRDSEGFVMASSSQKIEATFSLQMAEAFAISSELAIDTGRGGPTLRPGGARAQPQHLKKN
ncbi:hypothetical protein Dsin_012623 [Dipteronia sinensis]|uniref:RNase H type-1 domain-containing protein n=1 Tax=Dipteronia sinensis TaxID=43782 RepID=A0AAE0AIF4_9ROSI|nr:hypothetical protein Dsin_012623 [Dipteronia sinensis]